MELLQVTSKIQECINLLSVGRKKLKERGQKKADSIAVYDRTLRDKMKELRDAKDYPVTIIEKLAKGDCFNERHAMELAENEYRNLLTGITVILAQLNAYQSILRNQEEV